MNYGQGELHCGVGDYYRLHLNSLPIQPSKPDPTSQLARRAMATTGGNENAAAMLMSECGVSYVDAIHLCLRAQKPEPGEEIEPFQRPLDGTIATLLRDPEHTAITVMTEVAQATGLTFTDAAVRVSRVGRLGYDRLNELAGPPAPAPHERGYRRMR